MTAKSFSKHLPKKISPIFFGLLAMVFLVAKISGFGAQVSFTENGVWPKHPMGTTSDSAFYNNHLYLALGDSGLAIFDANNPTNLSRVGSYAMADSCIGVSVTNNLAYVLSKYFIEIVDVSNPSLPKSVTTNSFGNFYLGKSIAVWGEVAYVADENFGILVLDVKETDKVIHWSRVTTVTNAFKVTIQNGKLHLIDKRQGLSIYNIADPFNPILERSPTNFVVSTFNSQVYDTAADDTYLYLAHDSNLIIRHASTLQIIGRYQSPVDIRHIQVIGNVAYLIDVQGKLLILDIADRANPQLTASVSIGSNTPVGFITTNDRAYATWDIQGIDTYDISSPTNPVHLAHAESYSSAGILRIQNNFAYILDYFGFTVIDLSVPLSETSFLSTTEIQGPKNSLFMNGTRAFISAGYSGVQILDIADQSTPRQISTFNDYPAADKIYSSATQVIGDLAYVHDNSGKFKVYDIKNPFEPILLKGYETVPSGPFHVMNDMAYLISSNQLQIYDIASTNSITLLGKQKIDSSIDSIASVFENNLILRSNEKGLFIFDVSNPSAVTNISTIKVRSTFRTYIHDHFLFANQYLDPEYLSAWDISVPKSPKLAGKVFIRAGDIAVDENRIYLTGGGHVLRSLTWTVGSGLPPMLTQDLTNKSLIVGTNHTFRILAEGIEPLTYRWEKDGVTIQNGGRITGATTNSLTISNLHLLDAGSYTCFVGNEFGETDSLAARLNVVEPPDFNVSPMKFWGGFRRSPLNIVTVSGNFAYASSDSALLIINIEDKENPFIAGQITNSLRDTTMAIGDNCLLLGKGTNGLHIIDITNPTQPKYASKLLGSQGILNICIQDNIAYLARGNMGLMIVDISNPTKPIILSYYQSFAKDVAVRDGIAYLATSTSFSGVLDVVDVSNPATPVSIGKSVPGGISTAIWLSGNNAYVCMAETDLRVFDISNPATPILKNSVPLSTSVMRVRTMGNYAFLASTAGSLRVFDMTDPDLPTPRPELLHSRVGMFDLRNNFLYSVGDTYDFRILALNEALETNVVGSTVVFGRSQKVQATTNKVYLADGSAGLHAFEFTPPSDLHHLGRYVGDRSKGINNFYAYNDQVYLLNGKEMHIVNFEDPSQPELLGIYKAKTNLTTISGSGDRMVLYNDKSGTAPAEILLFDISNPTNLTLTAITSIIPASSGTPNLKLTDNHLYMSLPSNSLLGDVLKIFDISTPSVIRLIHQLQIRGFGVMDINENHAFIGDNFQIHDISNPKNIRLIGALSSPDGVVRDIVVEGDYAYLASSGTGILTVYIGTPSNPVIVNQHVNNRTIWDIDIQGDYAFVASDYWGLEVFQIRPSAILPLELTGSSTPHSTHPFVLHGQGGRGTIYLEASTNLLDWLPITNRPASNTPVELIDPESALHPHRFYRLRAGE